MVAARSLGCEWRLDAFRMCKLQRAIHLVGRDVVETLAFVFLGQRLPVELGGLQQSECAHHVGACEGEGVLDRAVDMTLGSKVDDAVDVVFLHQAHYELEVADVALYECVVVAVLYVLEVGEVSRIRQFVEIDDMIFGVLVDE